MLSVMVEEWDVDEDALHSGEDKTYFQMQMMKK